MENEDEVKEIVMVERTDSTGQAVEKEFAELLGAPDADQKKILSDLGRLHRSLHGPENLLDQGNYNRPFPVKPHRNVEGQKPNRQRGDN